MSMTATPIEDRTVQVWNGRVNLNFKVSGSGSPLVYLHPAAGLVWDPFLSAMAENHTVYAPECPGTTLGDPHAIHEVDDLHDLILIYEEGIRALGLSEPAILVGQSFGGMLAMELAAHFPDLFSRLVLLGAIGLWHEDAPLAYWMEAGPADLPPMLFHDPSGPAATAMFTLPDDPDVAVAMQAGLVWALGCTGKFCWPIPDRGLDKRLHRIRTQTLIVWGENDALNPVVYAHELGNRIAGSRVEIFPECGHIPQMEKYEETVAVVRDFLGDS
jgi:pimeloyl-ACP methyl ester carboxylesterase